MSEAQVRITAWIAILAFMLGFAFSPFDMIGSRILDGLIVAGIAAVIGWFFVTKVLLGPDR